MFHTFQCIIICLPSFVCCCCFTITSFHYDTNSKQRPPAVFSNATNKSSDISCLGSLRFEIKGHFLEKYPTYGRQYNTVTCQRKTLSCLPSSYQGEKNALCFALHVNVSAHGVIVSLSYKANCHKDYNRCSAPCECRNTSAVGRKKQK